MAVNWSSRRNLENLARICNHGGGIEREAESREGGLVGVREAGGFDRIWGEERGVCLDYTVGLIGELAVEK